MKIQTIHHTNVNGYDIVTLASEGQYPAWYRVFNADGQGVGKFPSMAAAVMHAWSMPASTVANKGGTSVAVNLATLLDQVFQDPGYGSLSPALRLQIGEALRLPIKDALNGHS